MTAVLDTVAKEVLPPMRSGLYWRSEYAHEHPYVPTGPTIQAIDTDDDTIYVLHRPGQDPIAAYWPHPLLELEPDAERIASWREPDIRQGIVVQVGPETEFARGGRETMGTTFTKRRQREERKLLKTKTEQLQLWRRRRPRRFLRTGRKHSKSARLSEADIRRIQWRHYVGYESLRSICREQWQEKGYASDKSMLNTVCDTLKAYGLRKRSPSEMTAHTNRMRSTRLEGETKNEFRRRRRRELGQAHGRVCEAVKTRYGKGRGEQCQRAALDDSTFCSNHDPRYQERNAEILEHARSSRAA
jgi:hypothetical protein